MNLKTEKRGWKGEIQDFTLAIISHWLWWIGVTVASGFVAFVQGVGGTIPVWSVWIVGAAIGLIVASFLAWQDERRKVVALRERLIPNLRLSYSPDISGCIRFGNLAVTQERCRFLRVSVENLCPEPLLGCKGVLTKIERDGKEIWGGDNAELPFAPSEQPDSLSKTINDKTPEFLDVVFLTEKGFAFLAAKRWHYSVPKDSLFKEYADYQLHIAVTSSNSPTAEIIVKFTWNGNWKDASLSLSKKEKTRQRSRSQ